MTQRPTVHLKPREGRRLRAGAPWAFSNEVVMDADTKALAPGSLVQVVGDDGRAFGTFYFSPKSLIALRRLDAAPDAVIDEAWFAARLAHAKSLRDGLYDRPFYRLVHAEGDRLGGLTIDRFGDVLVVQITTAGMESLIDPLLAALDAVLAPQAIVLRNDTPVRALEGLDQHVRAAKGEMPPRLALEENGIRYFADLAHGQKTGWYYDQRDNRAFMASLAKDRSLLDAYSYTGGFALVAAAAGAREVVALDSSAPALALAEDAAAANKLSARCRFVKADVFEELERLAVSGETFDIVIADPPPFVKAKKDLEAGAKAYRKLARLAALVTGPGGFLLLASCSHNISAERFALECATGLGRAGREGALIRQAGAGPDHPVHPALPETAYLKSLVYALD
jgi:23S rRNA (cytosine1962-C5)-methyltransferase